MLHDPKNFNNKFCRCKNCFFDMKKRAKENYFEYEDLILDILLNEGHDFNEKWWTWNEIYGWIPNSLASRIINFKIFETTQCLNQPIYQKGTIRQIKI